MGFFRLCALSPEFTLIPLLLFYILFITCLFSWVCSMARSDVFPAFLVVYLFVDGMGYGRVVEQISSTLLTSICYGAPSLCADLQISFVCSGKGPSWEWIFGIFSAWGFFSLLTCCFCCSCVPIAFCGYCIDFFVFGRTCAQLESFHMCVNVVHCLGGMTDLWTALCVFVDGENGGEVGSWEDDISDGNLLLLPNECACNCKEGRKEVWAAEWMAIDEDT